VPLDSGADMKDMIGRDIAVGDFVAYYSNLYEVKALASQTSQTGHGYAKILIYPAAKTSKPVKKYTREMVRIPPEDVTLYLLTKGNAP
jgi:hypothetical protein